MKILQIQPKTYLLQGLLRVFFKVFTTKLFSKPFSSSGWGRCVGLYLDTADVIAYERCWVIST